uniref:UV excision repair protein RAD23 n=1 Tax=Globodera rostochiensis TaxID=31243 RepID=A0A914I293_GLORO
MISVLFKTITQQSFTVEVEETATIGEVKQKIENAKGKEAFPVESQKLIFNGKVLEDIMTISELNITAPKFIVIMVMRKAAPPSSTAPATSTATAKKADGQPSTGVKSAAVAKQDGSTSATSADKSKSSAPSADVPSEHAQTVANIEAMGYPRQEVVRALQAAFFDAERAVEYLCNGIPEGLSLQRANSGEVGPQNEDEEELVQVPLDDPEGLAFLAQSPQFQQLRDMLRADPTMLPQIVQQIAATNPQLMELIRTNQAQFLQMLNDGQPLGEAGGDAVAAGDGGAAVGVGAPVAPQGEMPRRINIPVTPQDREAIARLVGMGFPETLVIEAYFACDKNEDLAVNYILARLDEFHNELAGDDQGGQ